MAIEKYTTISIVLQTFDQGEHDRVYKLFTRDFGVIMAHAKSIRKLESKLRAHLQVGNMCLVTLVKGREVWRITGAEGEQSPPVFVYDVIAIVTRFMRGEGTHKALFDRLRTLTYESSFYEATKVRTLLYYIVLVDLGYADAKVIGAQDRAEYLRFTVADLYTHLLLSYVDVRKHVRSVLADTQL